jgi:NAD(P)-dependent dehydrogenase (short-subunit alcohol dehydrogenase family)
MPNSSIYGASKAGLLSLARTLSGELISRGICVNAISPGPISTPPYHQLGIPEADLEAMADSLINQIPARRFGKPGEIAEAVVFFASGEAAFAVGSELVIDGGMSNL